MQSEQIVLGGGCFWCLEAAYQRVNGVTVVEPGYAGGRWPNPTYERVVGGTTGHAEVVRLTFNPTIINLAEILDIFWAIHDPTTPNRQGHDVGTEYRSIILYLGDDQLKISKESIRTAQELWPDPIVTEVAPLKVFYPAEPEHHNYFLNHPERAYCQIVINPKLQKLQQQYAEKLKPL